jgi:hypothetical protein
MLTSYCVVSGIKSAPPSAAWPSPQETLDGCPAPKWFEGSGASNIGLRNVTLQR